MSLPLRRDRPKPRCDRSPQLLTIGYEGKSLSEYLKQLQDAAVTVLCDVRRNPLSRKKGFSRRALAEAVGAAGIRYEHLPELGIASAERKEVRTPEDRAVLFARYQRETLNREAASVAKIRSWVEDDGERLALTCFEKDACECHRNCIAHVLANSGAPTLTPIHL